MCRFILIEFVVFVLNLVFCAMQGELVIPLTNFKEAYLKTSVSYLIEECVKLVNVNLRFLCVVFYKPFYKSINGIFVINFYYCFVFPLGRVNRYIYRGD